MYKYDLGWLALLAASTGLLLKASWTRPTLDWGWLPLVLPVAGYLSVLGHVLVHNASHLNLPPVPNAIVGEIGGLLVGTRFAAWQILHDRHHRYPDDRAKDPHPVERSFFRFVLRQMIGNLEPNIHQQFYERFGASRERRVQAKVRTVLGLVTTIALLAFWLALLGPWFFAFVYVPATAFSALYVAHFNWVTHDARAEDGVHHPVDLDTGYYWFANRILFGLYLHATHHAHPRCFNPLRARA